MRFCAICAAFLLPAAALAQPKPKAEPAKKTEPPFKIEIPGKDGPEEFTNGRKATASLKRAAIQIAKDPSQVFEAKLTINGTIFKFASPGDANAAVVAIRRVQAMARRSRLKLEDLGHFKELPAPPPVAVGRPKRKLTPAQAQAMLQLRVKQAVNRHIARYGRPPSPQSAGLIWRGEYQKALQEGWWPTAQAAPKPVAPQPALKPAEKPTREQIQKARRKAKIESLREALYPALQKGSLVNGEPAKKPGE